MLLLRAWLKTPVDENNACYEVAVFINAKQIWQGEISGHIRAKGWTALVKRIALFANLQSESDRKQLEESLALLYNKDLKDNRVKCPACNKHVSRTYSPACPKCGSTRLRCVNGCTWEIDSR